MTNNNKIPCGRCGKLIDQVETRPGLIEITDCLECKRNFHRAIIEQDLGFKAEHMTMTFESFNKIKDLTPSQSAAYFKFRNYNMENPQSMYVFGPGGCLKTHLICALCHSLADNFKYVCFRVGLDILEEIRSCFIPGSKIPSKSIVEKYVNTSILVLDDLGVEKTIDNFGIEKMTEFSRQTFYAIAHGRDIRHLPTIITSNYSPDELAFIMDGPDGPDRIVSRFIHYSTVIKIDGPDGRLKRNKDE